MLARIAIDFLGEMHWPGEVEIGTAVVAGRQFLDRARPGAVRRRPMRRHRREHVGADRQGDAQAAAVRARARRADQGGGAGGAGGGVNRAGLRSNGRRAPPPRPSPASGRGSWAACVANCAVITTALSPLPLAGEGWGGGFLQRRASVGPVYRSAATAGSNPIREPDDEIVPVRHLHLRQRRARSISSLSPISLLAASR